MDTARSFLRTATVAIMVFALFGCGGGSNGAGSSSGGSGANGGSGSGTTTPTPVSLAVAVIGLNGGASFVLQDGAGDQVTVAASGNTTLPIKAGAGSAYTLSIPTQPAGEFCNLRNATGTAGAASNPTVSIGCAQVLAGGSGSIPAAGGSFTSAAADVTVPAAASLNDQSITVTTIAPPAGIPASVVPIGAAIDVAIDQPARLNAPLIVTLRYDASIVTDESNLAVLHYNTTTNSYEPVTILAQDTTAHTFTIASRVFSPFVIVAFDPSVLLPDSYDTGFFPANNGWNIDNPDNYFSPDGNCLGMAAYAVWYFGNKSDKLFGRYPTDGNPSIAKIVAVRAFLAQSQFWARQQDYFLRTIGAQQTAKLLRFYMSVFHQPLILTLRSSEGGHAVVVYGFDPGSFRLYDVNDPGESQSVAFDGTAFSPYNSFDTIGFVALSSLGRTEDFSELADEAAGGFTHAQYISVSSPDTSAPLTSSPIVISGTLAPGLDPLAELIGYIPEAGSADPAPIPLVQGSFGDFSHTVRSPNLGDTTVVLLAGIHLHDQTGWYPSSDAYLFTMTFQSDSQIKPANPNVLLGKTQTLVAQPLDGSFPDGATFKWTLTGDGAGSIGASSTVTTTINFITYTASATKTGTDTLTVIVFDSRGRQISTGTTTVQVTTTNGCYGLTPSLSNPGSTYSLTLADTNFGVTGTIQSDYAWKGSVAFSDPPFTSTANEYDVTSVFTYPAPAPSDLNRTELVATFGSTLEDSSYVIYGYTETSKSSGGSSSQITAAANPPLPFGKVLQLVPGGQSIDLLYSGSGTSGGGTGAGSYTENWQLLDTPTIAIPPAGTFKTCRFQVITSNQPNVIDTKWMLYGYGFVVQETITNTSSGTPVVGNTRQATALSINGAPYAGP